MSKNLSTIIVLTFVLVLGLYVAGFWVYHKYQSQISGTVSVFDSITNLFKGTGK